jgi:hypothetical protein
LSLGDRVGYTVRTYVVDDDEPTPAAVFPGVAGRLSLFRRPEQAAAFAVGGTDHDLSSVLHWDALSESMAAAFLPLLDDNRYELDLPVAILEQEPSHWLPDLILRAGAVASELVDALEIEEGWELLEAGSPLDHLDDVLRRAPRRPLRRYRKEWLELDRHALADQWQLLTEAIAERLDWHDQPY